jgi:hypothetical protein
MHIVFFQPELPEPAAFLSRQRQSRTFLSHQVLTSFIILRIQQVITFSLEDIFILRLLDDLLNQL